jgi:hypothetical protein
MFRRQFYRRFAILAVTWLSFDALVWQGFPTCRADDVSKQENHPPIELWLVDQKESESIFVDLESLSKQLHVTIRLNNRTGKPIKVQKCLRSCSCLSVELLRDEVKDGEVMEMRLSASFDPHPKSLEQALSLQLETTGGRSFISLQMRGKLSRFVGFQDSSRVLKASPKQTSIDASIPVMISDDIDRSQLNVVDSAKYLKTKSMEQRDGVTMLKCRFDIPNAAEPTTLEIRDKHDKVISQTSVEFLTTNWIEFLPSQLAFRVCPPFGEFVSEASGIIRLRAESSDYNTLIGLECETDTDVRLPVTWSKVRDGYYRFRVCTIEQDDLLGAKSISLKYLTPHGRGVQHLTFAK